MAKRRPPDVVIRLQPKQEHLYRLLRDTPATTIGVGGSRGGAKSGGARRVMLRRRFDYPGTTGMIFRRTYPQLLDNHIEAMLREFPALQGGYNKGEKNLRLRGGSTIAFRYGESFKDIEGFLGKEFQDIIVDQAESLTEQELQYLKSCCRWPGVPDNQCKFIMTFNPGGRGSGYLKRIFIERRYKPEEQASDFAFIQARGWDNIEWVRPYLERAGVSERQYYRDWTEQQRQDCFLQHSSYGRTMLAAPPGVRAGWLYGDFDSFSGQYFENFSERQIVEPGEMHWRPWFKRWIAIDWGYQHNAAVGWFTEACRGHESAKPVYWMYREFIKNRMGSREFAEKIVELSAGEQIDAVYMDSGAKSRTDSSETPFDQINREFRAVGLPMAGLANKDRKGGWQLLREMFGLNDAEPRLVISRECARTIDTIPLMCVDPEDREDCEKFDSNEQGEGGDDACFVAGTAIETLGGSRPIESLAAGDYVLTRKGYRRVLAAGLTAENVPVVRCAGLTATAAHPVFSGGKFIRLDSLAVGDTVESWNPIKKLLFRAACTAYGMGATTARGADSCTATSGNPPMVRSRRAAISTIGTETASTTNWKIWNALTRPLISACTPLHAKRPLAMPHAARRPHGIAPKPEGNGTAPWLASGALGICSAANATATIAGSRMQPGMLRRGSARMPANRPSAGRSGWTTWKQRALAAAGNFWRIATARPRIAAVNAPCLPAGAADVYNLQVEDASEFYANGILVHNCDMLRYGMMSRLRPNKKPREKEIEEKLVAVEDMTEKAMVHRRLLGAMRKPLRSFRLR